MISRRGVLWGGLLAGAGAAVAAALSGVLTGRSGSGVTSFSVSKQSGTVAGDWIFIHLFGADSASVACTGFTVVEDQKNYGAFLRRLADGTEGSSFSITGLGGQPVSALIATVAGAASSLDAAVVTPTSSSNSTSLGVAGITVGTAGDWVLCFAGNQDGYSKASYAVTPPSGFTTKATNGAQTGNPAMMLADNESATAGATGTKICTSASASCWSGVMVALKPAPVPTGPPGSWTQVFGDEFTGTSLDLTRWAYVDNAINGVPTCIGAAANVTVSGGFLHLTLASATSGAYISSSPSDGAGVNGWDLPVGGCVEARIYTPGPNSSTAYNWGGIFCSGQAWPANGEIDFWETLGSPSLNYHYGSGSTEEQSGPYHPSGNWANGWHTTTVVRGASTVKYWWDGVLVQTFATHDRGGPMSILPCNGAGNTAAYGIADAMMIDYVRGWVPASPGGSLSYRATPAVSQSSGGVS